VGDGDAGRAAYDRTILPAAQQAVDTATRGFEMGKFAFLDVLDAQRTLIEARGLYLEALASATDARKSSGSTAISMA
jgi:cobalt-zinc-cadmium efflux system outer membrane protein